MNLAGAITESADTRSWMSLPNQIYMVRVQLPEGTHRLGLSFLNSDGQLGNNRSVNDVVIQANQITLINFRTYK